MAPSCGSGPWAGVSASRRSCCARGSSGMGCFGRAVRRAGSASIPARTRPGSSRCSGISGGACRPPRLRGWRSSRRRVAASMPRPAARRVWGSSRRSFGQRSMDSTSRLPTTRLIACSQPSGSRPCSATSFYPTSTIWVCAGSAARRAWRRSTSRATSSAAGCSGSLAVGPRHPARERCLPAPRVSFTTFH